ncbi:MAG: MBL fold metallo-hydrolase [Anaerolineae bacterium]
MNITFQGAARQVTGSMHLVEVNGVHILLDCGMMQGHRAEANERNAHLPFDARDQSYMLLSHAHLDHSGNLPTLVKSGYPGELYCTPATLDLTRLMLRDSAKIQEQDAAYWNKKNPREPIQPLYTTPDAEAAIKAFSAKSYDFEFGLERAGTRATFHDAGHILGSAMSVLEMREQTRTVRLCFTGDLGRKGTLILRDPTPAPPVDYLIVESTYGDRVHSPVDQSEEELAEIVRATSARGGKTIIPAFALERTQEIVYSLHRSMVTGKLDPAPIFVDSPLAIDATDVFRLHAECFDDETRQFMAQHEDPWGFRQLTYTRDVEASKAINNWRGPAVIISANGMVEAGRILHHVKNNIEDARNTILFVGYQADGTLGRRILDGAKHVKIFGQEYQVRAQVARAEGFSAHADRNELLDWVRPIVRDLKGVFLVHGEPEAAQSLAEGMRELGIKNVLVPAPGQRVEL